MADQRKPIVKPSRIAATANLRDYAETARSFTWEQARGELDGLPDGRGLNIAHEAVDRHAEGKRGEKIAIRWLGKTGQVKDLSYAR